MAVFAMFTDLFESLTGNPPFPWQEALYERFISDRTDNIPASCSIPTGLGKTSVLAIWLIALATHPDKMPRRLVYVVNRRTVVDQTTNEAINLRNNAPRIGIDNLAISTLRGQFADNREWSADPSRPAVICGTVDMIGSRLLFSGYNVGFKSRPLHAGFLGQGALLIHDEAHLEPAFQRLMERIEAEQERERISAGNLPSSNLRVMQLTATTRGENGPAPFNLTSEDRKHPIVRQRIEAKKQVTLTSVVDEKLAAAKIAEIAVNYKDSNACVLVFARTLDAVASIEKELGKTSCPVMLLTGTMRGKERDDLVEQSDFKRFTKGGEPGETVYLLCTSAGEVGIDISADHMVCDLSTLESMAQRFGRVNRYGEGDARIDVVYPQKFDERDKLAPARHATLGLLRRLDRDGSPKSLGELIVKLTDEERKSAFAPPPVILETTDILFDAWSLTSIRQTMPGSPTVEPYLHGIADWQPPETYVAWRDEVGRITGELLDRYPPADLLDDYPLLAHELLRDATDRKNSGVFAELEKIASRCPEAPVWIVDPHGEVTAMKMSQLISAGSRTIYNATVVLSPSVGGLSTGGVLAGDSTTADDVADEIFDASKQQRRKRLFSDQPRPDGPSVMGLIATIDMDPDADEREIPQEERDFESNEGDQESASTNRARYWHWYARPRDAEDATCASTKPIKWNHHTNDVVRWMTEIVNALNLPAELKQTLILAADLHDLGKKRVQWQLGIGNPNPCDWHAKPGKPDGKPRWRQQHVSDYRHEFGSLLDATRDIRFNALSNEMKDLVLHLIAAHHGRARPHFTPDEAIDPTPPVGASPDDMAMETPRRFARLQRKYGRWGLAYLESILRAADWAASANRPLPKGTEMR